MDSANRMTVDRSGKTDWLTQGLALLEENGAPAVRLDRLCARMELSKGAFYHHFGSMPNYRTQLLDHFETRFTTTIIDSIEAADGVPAATRLERLLDAVTDGVTPSLEIAMRAWATQDAEAAAMQERVDATRIGYLRELCSRAGHADADRLATLIYLVLVGAEHLLPPLPKSELRGIYDYLMPILTQR